jgi:hypothetical protein
MSMTGHGRLLPVRSQLPVSTPSGPPRTAGIRRSNEVSFRRFGAGTIGGGVRIYTVRLM